MEYTCTKFGVDRLIRFSFRTRIHADTHMGVDPYWTGGTCPANIYEGGTSMVMSPNILEVMSFRISTRVNTRNYVQIPKDSG